MKRWSKAIRSLDASAQSPSLAGRWLERTSLLFVFIMAAAAPHSIAATQTAWLIGMLAWTARSFVKPRPAFRLTAPGIALIALFGWTALSAVFSYEPAISLDKLRAPTIFLIFFLVLNLVKQRRTAFAVAVLMITSCMVSVVWTPVEKIIGRGVQVHGVAVEGSLAKIGVTSGDVIVRVNGKLVQSPATIITYLLSDGPSRLELNRLDGVFHREIGPFDRSATMAPEERLGFTEWNRFRGFRADGFYGHFTTYAEMLQLVGALALGLFVAALTGGAARGAVMAFGASFAGIGAALLLTVTRASQLGMLASSALIVLLSRSRRVIIFAMLVAIPVAGLGMFYLRQQRQVGVLDVKDNSIKYRQMMWHDGLRLLGENPRHLIVGVGMETIKTHWQEWGLFDNGHQPMGHFHSTPMQLAVERGLPALLIWAIFAMLLARSLWRGIARTTGDWRARGVVLGSLGALVGFLTSGLVHYNLGDQEVAMVFYILIGLGVSISEMPRSDDILLMDSPILRDRNPEPFRQETA